MSQPAQVATPQPSGSNQSGTPRRPAAAVGNVPFALVLLSAILVLIPGSRTVGLAFLLVLAIPAVVVWLRARKLTDGSRGLTTGTLIIGMGAFVLGGALSPAAPSAPTTATVPAVPIEQAVPRPLVVTPPAPQLVPAPQPFEQASPPAVAPAPRVTPAPRVVPAPQVVPAPRVVPAPAPRTEAQDSGGGAYYKNCAEARAAGAAPIQKGEPGYRPALDRDSDGTACDK
ncbi:MAG: excalibur calcium-binding domain-containing protein [Pseudonocardia sp.]